MENKTVKESTRNLSPRNLVLLFWYAITLIHYLTLKLEYLSANYPASHFHLLRTLYPLKS